MGPFHINQAWQSQTVPWHTMDSEGTFIVNYNDLKTRAKLEEHGWLDPNCISYAFNSEGFRDDEFTDEPAGIALGCSFTQGIGVDLDNTWPRRLAEKIGHRVWNLGVGGSASDTAYRLAEHWIKHLNVKFVTMLVPSIERVEIWHQGRAHVLMHNHNAMPQLKEYKMIYWTNLENGQNNQNKNLYAIKQLCAEKQIPFRFQFKDQWQNADLGRDLAHWGRKSNEIFAEKMYNLIKGIES